mmetsp:Transcript_5257/g.11933  ORF Transcript_5257/g.11933 Transcript_5257/m.11933 type:complete len:230 (+) Transcript_5257:86-775(+)
MACCDFKQGTGKCLVFFFTILFGLGVTISTLSPNWITFVTTDETRGGSYDEVEWGPFYGQFRTCTGGDGGSCGKWQTKSLDTSDCDSIEGYDDIQTLCRHLNTWRITGILCLCLVLIGGGLVFAASCCQMVTCGCCGNSLTCISNVLFWAEVLLSIVTWAFAISSLSLIKAGPSVSSSGYQWGFWLFLFSGTVFGAIAAWMADWAAEDSALRGIWQCITCKRCRQGEEA